MQIQVIEHFCFLFFLGDIDLYLTFYVLCSHICSSYKFSRENRVLIDDWASMGHFIFDSIFAFKVLIYIICCLTPREFPFPFTARTISFSVISL